MREHLWKVIGIMQVFDMWDTFYKALNRILPKFSKKPLLAMMENDGEPAMIAAAVTVGEA